MSQDILNSNSTFGGAISAASTSFSFSNQGAGGTSLGTGLLVQDLQAQYAISVNKVWELGVGNRCYYIIGRPMGSLSMGRICGPAPIAAAFINTFTTACSVSKNVIAINVSNQFCDSNGNVVPGTGVTFANCLITAIGLRASSTDMMVMQQIQIMFNSLQSQ